MSPKKKKKKERKDLFEELFQEPGTGNSQDAGKENLFREEETASCGVLASLYLKQEFH